MLTVHNLAYHGWTPNGAQLDQLGLVQRGDPLAGTNPDGIDLLLTAIEGSELVNTVSPGFVVEALTPAFGMGLDGALRDLGDRWLGILNGIDPNVWNPATDAALAGTLRPREPRRPRRRAGGDLLARVGLRPRRRRRRAGHDRAARSRRRGSTSSPTGRRTCSAAGARIIVQGSGHASLADPFRALAAASPGRVALIEGFDREMARRIYAGADLFLMPSRFEPCGQGQMISLRYGTPPVVRRTGGLADSVST